MAPTSGSLVVCSLASVKQPSHDSFEFWWAYTETCRALATQAGVSMRVLDRALWQYSNARQG